MRNKDAGKTTLGFCLGQPVTPVDTRRVVCCNQKFNVLPDLGWGWEVGLGASLQSNIITIF